MVFVQSDDTPIARIQEAMSKLDSLDAVSIAEHPALFDQVHAVLTESLAAVDGA